MTGSIKPQGELTPSEQEIGFPVVEQTDTDTDRDFVLRVLRVGRPHTLDDAERELAEARAEIERLRQQVTQRGARMQIMREWMATRAGMRVWASFCLEHPEAADWFDEDGVPL